MTRVYRLDLESAQIAARFGAEAGRDAWKGGAVSPGQFAPVIARSGRQAQLLIRPMHWGYPAPGQSTESPGTAPLRWVPTVRNIDSPFWIGNLRHSELRCLVPATSFPVGSGKRRQWLRVKSDAAFAFAGIWRDLTDMPVFAILSTDPPAGTDAASMPLILSQGERHEWLSADWKAARKMVRPIDIEILVPADNG